jgi:hypothetical protein
VADRADGVDDGHEGASDGAEDALDLGVVLVDVGVDVDGGTYARDDGTHFENVVWFGLVSSVVEVKCTCVKTWVWLQE